MSVNVTAPVIGTADRGVNVTLMGQDDPTAKEPPTGQLVLLPKFPVVTMLVIKRTSVPVLVKFMICGVLVVLTCWTPNKRLVIERLAMGARAAPPNPFREITCGLPAAESVMVVKPVKAAALKGENVTLIVHLEPAASVPPQEVELPKFPVVMMLVIVRLEFPVFVRVTT